MKQNYSIRLEKHFQKFALSDDERSRIVSEIELVYKGFEADTGAQNVSADLDWAFDLAALLYDEFRLGPVTAIVSFLWRPFVRKQLSFEAVTEKWGKATFSILEGLRKLDALDMSKTEIHSENFIQLLLSISADVRVVLIKTAERLSAIRQVRKMSEKEQDQIAREASKLYAPIAHRLGLYLVKSEFEELAMKQLRPEAYHEIAQKLNETKRSREAYIDSFIKPIQQSLDRKGFSCDIKGRPKSIHSIYSKMAQQTVDFEEVYDLFAIRVILDSTGSQEKADCWQVYSIITDEYQPNPNRLRDWISTPKANGYESLHTTVIGPDGKWIEVQIRTKRMDEIAEHGHAAHWKYKEVKTGQDQDGWLTDLKLALQTTDKAESVPSDIAKKELYSDQIYVFTPQGDLIKLRKGSRILDFAFAVHTNVGYHCTGGKVNGKIVPIKHELVNGDQVEILTSAQQKPKSDWLNWVRTSKAKTRIKRVLKEADYRDADEGKETLKRKFEQWKIKYDVTTIHRLVNEFNLKHALELYQHVADAKIDLNQIRELLKTKDPAEYLKSKPESVKTIESFVKSSVQQEDYLIIEEALDQVDYKMAKCCHPIYGDEVFGFVTVSEGTKVHRVNCPNAKQMIKRYPYRILKVQWADKHGDAANYSVNIRITGIDDIGIINEISRVISSDLKVNMRAMNVSSDDGIFVGQITMVVQDKMHLDTIITKLKKVKGVLTVIRSDE